MNLHLLNSCLLYLIYVFLQLNYQFMLLFDLFTEHILLFYIIHEFLSQFLIFVLYLSESSIHKCWVVCVITNRVPYSEFSFNWGNWLFIFIFRLFISLFHALARFIWVLVIDRILLLFKIYVVLYSLLYFLLVRCQYLLFLVLL